MLFVSVVPCSARCIATSAAGCCKPRIRPSRACWVSYTSLNGFCFDLSSAKALTLCATQCPDNSLQSCRCWSD